MKVSIVMFGVDFGLSFEGAVLKLRRGQHGNSDLLECRGYGLATRRLGWSGVIAEAEGLISSMCCEHPNKQEASLLQHHMPVGVHGEPENGYSQIPPLSGGGL